MLLRILIGSSMHFHLQHCWRHVGLIKQQTAASTGSVCTCSPIHTSRSFTCLGNATAAMAAYC
jgi:hypothetical protein